MRRLELIGAMAGHLATEGENRVASNDVVAFRTRHLVALRKLARARATTVSKMFAVEAEKMIFHDSRAEIKAALNAAMDAVGDLAWTALDSPQRTDVLARLNQALSDFDHALDKAGL